MSARKEYLNRLKSKLDEWDAELDKLEERSRALQAETQARYRRQLDEVRQHRDELHRRYQDLQKASESAWDQLRAGAEDAWRTLDEAFRRTRKRD